jgi:hypothetical protein
MLKQFGLLIILLACFNLTNAQNDSLKLVKLGPGFRFADGLYLNHNQLLNNNPIPKKWIVTNLNRNDFDFFSKLINQDKVEYYDRYGLKKTIKVDELWGFCNRGSIYINTNNEFFRVQAKGSVNMNMAKEFFRVPIVGSICHFVANIDVYDYDNASAAYGYYSAPLTPSKHIEIQQFIMDFKTGKVLEYDVENLTTLLRADSTLYNEFTNLKKRKQNELKFLYLRKFNEKFPLYIPVP